jgi:hypothetical protein
VARAHAVAAKSQTGLTHIHDRKGGASHECELNYAEPDGARADNEDKIIRLRLRPLHGVRPYAEGFDEGELLVVERSGAMELVRRHGEVAAHASVDVDAHNSDLSATVRFATAARDAAAAIDRGLYGAAVTCAETGGFSSKINDLDAELVPEDARIPEEGLLAGEGVTIGATYADTMDAHEHFTGCQGQLGRVCARREFSGFI